MKSKVGKFYLIRLIIFSIIYFIIAEVLLLFVYICVYPKEPTIEKVEKGTEYVFDVVETEFTVVRIQDIVSVEGNKGVKVLFKGASSKFDIELYEDFADLKVGMLYKGYEISYTAEYLGNSWSSYKAQIFYYGQNRDSILTLADYKKQVCLDILENEMRAYLMVYRRNLLLFCGVSILVLSLLSYIRVNILYRKKLRKIQLQKMQQGMNTFTVVE